ncbi:MAG: hypothetical protein WC283_02505 [Candidatus Paceibacterota bacterium]|jgi:aspartate carbamoyltransferase regulatory subunit
MIKDLVIVQSKTINNESVTVVINTIEPGTGEDEIREISRSVIFQNFQSEMPFKWAKYLINTFPNEYVIIKKGKGKLSKRAKSAVKVAQEKNKGFQCPYCTATLKSKAGLKAHIRISHPDKWEGKKTVKKIK